MSVNNLLSQEASVRRAIYSTSVVDKETTSYFLLNQMTAVPDITNTLPVMEWQLSISPAQSTSE